MVLDTNGFNFEPEINESEHITITVSNIVSSWVRDFVTIGTLVGRQDTGGVGDHMNEINNSFAIRDQLANISENLDFTEEECKKYKSKFNDFRDLWEKDPEATFEEFIQIEVEKEMEILIKKNQDSADKKSGAPGLPSSQEEPKVLTNEDTIFDASLPLLKGAAANIPKLDLFDEKITELENKKAEIAGKKAVHDIGWLRINVLPLKERLGIKIQT
jgi:hypothetical protein